MSSASESDEANEPRTPQAQAAPKASREYVLGVEQSRAKSTKTRVYENFDGEGSDLIFHYRAPTQADEDEAQDAGINTHTGRGPARIETNSGKINRTFINRCVTEVQVKPPGKDPQTIVEEAREGEGIQDPSFVKGLRPSIVGDLSDCIDGYDKMSPETKEAFEKFR